MALAPIVSSGQLPETESQDNEFDSELHDAFVDAVKQLDKKKSHSDESVNPMAILISVPIPVQDRQMQLNSEILGSVQIQCTELKDTVKVKNGLTLNVIASVLQFSMAQQLSRASLSTLMQQSSSVQRASGATVGLNKSTQLLSDTPVDFTPFRQAALVTQTPPSKTAADTLMTTPVFTAPPQVAAATVTTPHAVVGAPVEFTSPRQTVPVTEAPLSTTKADTLMATPVFTAPQVAAAPATTSHAVVGAPVEFTSSRQTVPVTGTPLSTTKADTLMTTPVFAAPPQVAAAPVTTPHAVVGAPVEFTSSRQTVPVTETPLSTTKADTLMTTPVFAAPPQVAAAPATTSHAVVGAPVEFTSPRQTVPVTEAPLSTTKADTLMATPVFTAPPQVAAAPATTSHAVVGAPVEFTSSRQTVPVTETPLSTTKADTLMTTPVFAAPPQVAAAPATTSHAVVGAPVEFTSSRQTVPVTGTPLSTTKADTLMTTPVFAAPPQVAAAPATTSHAVVGAPVEFTSSRQTVPVTGTPLSTTKADILMTTPVFTAPPQVAAAPVTTPHAVVGAPVEFTSSRQASLVVTQIQVSGTTLNTGVTMPPAMQTALAQVQNTIQNIAVSTPSAPVAITPQAISVQIGTLSTSEQVVFGKEAELVKTNPSLLEKNGVQLVKQEISEITSALPAIISLGQTTQQTSPVTSQEQPMTTQNGTKQQTEMLAIRDKNAEVPKETKISLGGDKAVYLSGNSKSGYDLRASDEKTKQDMLGHGELPKGINSVESSIDKQPKQRQSTNQHHLDDANE